MSEEERKIKDVENRECGCVVTHYDDGGQLFRPCVPHGLIGVSQALQQAANAMGAVASVLQQEQAVGIVINNQDPHFHPSLALSLSCR